MANYGGAGRPYDDQTLAQCCGVSIECARGYGSSASAIKEKMDAGYGWGAAWFAWDPTNYRATVYYKKTGQGQYDDKPYEY